MEQILNKISLSVGLLIYTVRYSSTPVSSPVSEPIVNKDLSSLLALFF